MATTTPNPAEILQGDLTHLIARDEDEDEKCKITIARHPLLLTSQLAGGVTLKQATDRHHINIYHTDNPETNFLRTRDTIVRSHVELNRDGSVNLGIHSGAVEVDKYEEQLAYAMSSYLPEAIIMKALRRQPKPLTIHRPLDELTELIDFIDFTTKYGVSR